MKAISTLLTCLALMAFSNIDAQVTANFSIDYPNGCSPLSVNFTNTSIGTGTLTYVWDLGNGNNSTLKDPTAIYSNAGSYTVKLTVSDGTQSNSIQKTITVHKNPVANFSASQKGCIPINISFNDLSVKGDANITKWNWDFRNGVLSSEKNPEFNYTSAGKFDVFLQVTDGNGCKSTSEKLKYIDVVEKPMVSFFATPSTSCKVPTNVQFTNQSSGGGTLTHAWDFGGGSTSVLQNPTHSYNAFGSYNVKLTVTSNYGCNSTINVPAVQIGEVNASGTIKQGTKTIQNNNIICSGNIDFTNNSTGNTLCLWDFGDGSTTNTSSGKHLYPNAGNYKIKLIAAPYDVCADTLIWNITVEKAVASFTFSPESSCNTSTPVAFTNQSSANIISYKWVFSDGTNSTLRNVNKTYTQPKDKDPYMIHDASSYPVMLVVTSTNGCKDSIEKHFDVQQPTALFSVDSVKGCVPLTVTFTNQSMSSNPIASSDWHWGEGAVQNTTLNNIDHTYNTPGTYNVKMVVKTNSGCKDTSAIITIKVGSHVTPDFTVTAAICASQKIEFTNPTPTGQSRWHYSINGIGVPSCPEVANPSVFMKTNIGSFPVKLIVENNGCQSEVTKPNAINNTGPTGNFDYVHNCTSARSVTFKGIANSATSFKWEFGDSQSNTTDLEPIYVFGNENNFTVKFIAFNGACSDTTIRVVKIRNHTPAFVTKTEACAGDVILFYSNSTGKLHDSGKEKYLWNFNDSSQFIRTKKDSSFHTFSKGGNFNVKLFAFYDDGCVDSTTNAIRIYKPKPLFTANKTEGCSPLPVTFTDNSLPDFYAIKSWNWDFGDDKTASYTAKLNTMDHLFENPGEYITTLSVTDNFNCTSTYEKRIATAQPIATFNAITPTEICTGNEVQFVMDFQDPDSAIWNFENGHTLKSIAFPASYEYPDSGSFDVSLLVYKYGCSSQFTYDNFIKVQKANARFTASDTILKCYPNLVTLTHTANKNIESGKWYYGDGDNSSPGYLNTINYNYNRPGNFRAKLEITTSFGCTDTFSRVLKITGPTGSFDINPSDACKGDIITYTLKDTSNVFSYKWDLGDGNLSFSNPVNHKFSSVGNKTVKLILYGDNGKCIPPAIVDSVNIYNIKAGISIEDTSICEGTTVEFKNTSTGASSYKWDFGNGIVSTLESPQNMLTPGTYKVTLMTTGLFGCKDTAIQYILVSKIPTLSISNDTTICVGGLALLNAVSDKDIHWEPATDLSSSIITNPAANPKQSLFYKAYAVDALSKCFRRDSVEIIVQQKPIIELDVEDSTIIAGRPIQIVANTEDGTTFEWSPADFLSCNNCFNPISTARISTNYLVKVTDKNKCFTLEKSFNITVEPGEKAFDVPSAFTPGKGEENSIFKVEGYNIKQLLEFKIYNRWGNLVFSSNDRSIGWDGNYQGKPQPVDSYVYTIKVETFDGIIETKTGTVLLLR